MDFPVLCYFFKALNNADLIFVCDVIASQYILDGIERLGVHNDVIIMRFQCSLYRRLEGMGGLGRR